MFFVSPTQHYRSSVSTLFTFPTAASQGSSGLIAFPHGCTSSQAAKDHKLVGFYLTNYLILQSWTFSDKSFMYQDVPRLKYLFLPLLLLHVRHFLKDVRLHVSSKLLAFSRARIKLKLLFTSSFIFNLLLLLLKFLKLICCIKIILWYLSFFFWYWMSVFYC